MECLNHPKSRGDSRPRLSGRPQGDFGVRRMSETKAFAEQIIRTLRENGHQAYLVGGCVRDLSARSRTHRLRRCHRRHARRGHADLSRNLRRGRAVRSRAGSAQETTRTTRSKSPPSAATSATATAAIPTRYASARVAQEDVERRDFTINGLLLDPVNERSAGFRRRPQRPRSRNHSHHRRS